LRVVSSRDQKLLLERQVVELGDLVEADSNDSLRIFMASGGAVAYPCSLPSAVFSVH
jgi:hypothetical protein